MCAAERSPDRMALRRLVEGRAREDTPGVAVAVLDGGRVAFESTRGLANLHSKAPIGLDTQFYLASVSKQFTAMAIAILEDRGLLQYEATLQASFRDLPSHLRTITVEQLLRHTSGLGDYLAEPSPPQTNEEVLQRVRQNKELLFAPGTEFRYSNTGYNLLASIVQITSRQSFADFMKQMLFTPAGMSNTLVCTSLNALGQERAVGYHAKGAFTFVTSDYPLRTFGDGGIFSTLNDLSGWCRALQQHLLLKPAKQDQFFIRRALSGGETPDDKSGWFYGRGWFVADTQLGKRIQHGGGLAGFRSMVVWYPDLKIWLILLANRDDINLEVLARQMFQAYYGVASPEPKGPANRSQPVRSETNHTSAAAGSGR